MNESGPIIVSSVRTPIGVFGGSLRDVSHTKLAALVMDEVCRRVTFPKKDLDDVYWGVVMLRSDENGYGSDFISRKCGDCYGADQENISF